MTHHTKDKGDLAVAKVIADLTEKEYSILMPLSEHLPFDLVAYKQNKLYRIQCKYSSDGFIKNKTSWADKNGNHTRYYDQNDFDYFALYLTKIKICIYPSIKFGGCTVATSKPTTATPSYWYEDFLHFTDNAVKKNYQDHGIDLPPSSQRGIAKLNIRKVIRPSKDELEKLIWEIPSTKLSKQFGVSDVTIASWCKFYNISKPPRGYWS
jgi:hypothetical protein